MNSPPIFLRKYRTHSQLYQRDFYLPNNPYNEEEGRLHFLHKKPVCVLLLGHPCSGKTTLAKRLCQKWKLQLVNATELIKEHLILGSPVGKKMNEVMTDGRALDEEFVYGLIRDKLNSPECAHYGYVLEDLPTVGKTKSIPSEQVRYIMNLKLKPDYIVRILVPEEDLKRRRDSIRMDYEDGEIYTNRNYEPEVQINAESGENKDYISNINTKNTMDDVPGIEEEGVGPEALEEDAAIADELTHPDFPKLDKDTKERLMVRLEDLEEFREQEEKYYRENVTQQIKLIIARSNPLNVIELDGNQTPTEMFNNLLIRLQGMNLYPSVAPLRFFPQPGAAEEEEEIPEDVDTEELFSSLATKHMPGPRNRWSRSRWQRLCPVALYQGYLALGKPQFTVGFLGNIFCMSSPENLTEFMQNPRPYLLPPQPRPPFRVVIVGPSATGKTTLIHLLAEKYGARVIDLVGMLKGEYDAVMNKRLADVEAETQATVIEEVSERHEQELRALRESKMAEDAADSITNIIVHGLQKDAKETVVEDFIGEMQIEEENEPASVKEEEEEQSSAPPSIEEKPFYIPEHLRNPVDKEHPEVKTRVREALRKAKQQPVELDVDLYLDAVVTAVGDAEEKLRSENPGGPFRGNWIIDGLPMRAAVWKNFVEKAPELVPDLVVALLDGSENSEFILRRWYKLDREDLRVVEPPLSDESTDKEVSEEIEIAGPSTRAEDEDPLPPPGKQTEAALNRLKNDEKQWVQSAEIIRGAPVEYGIPHETLNVNIAGKTVEQLRDEIVRQLEKPLSIPSVEVSQAELEEQEEQDAEAFEEEGGEESVEEAEGEGNEEEAEEEGLGEGEENEEEEEEPDPSRNMDKKLGLTSYFCPVTLHDYGVLRAGDPEVGVIYDKMVYYFTDEEARSKFIQSPEGILSDIEHPILLPPPRILLLGPRGSGKTLHGRQLAYTLDLFFVSFDNILQEIVLPKVGRKLGKEYADEEIVPEIVLPPLNDGDGQSEVVQSLEPVPRDRADDRTLDPSSKVELNEHEANVVEYLTSGTGLPAETMNWILGKYWTQEPYRSKGFILEGFPNSGEELQFLAENKYYADLAIVINAESDEVVSRLLPVLLESWRKRMAKKAANAAALKRWKAAKKVLLMKKRRAELLQKLQEKRANARAAKASGASEVGEEDEELDDEVDIDEVLANEIEEEDEEVNLEEEETEEDAVDRLTEEITERYDESSDNLQEVLDQLEEMSIPKIEVDGGGKITWVRYRLVKKVNSVIGNREAMFERVYPVSPKVAERLINNGHAFPSRFGRWCPVTQALSQAWLIPPPVPVVKVPHLRYVGPLPGTPGETLSSQRPITCAAMYKENIYWFKNQAARTLFTKNPIKYLRGQPDPPIMMPLRLSLVGAPKTGKSTLAKRIVQEMEVPSFTANDAIKWILTDQSHKFTNLAERMRTHMIRGDAIPDVLVALAIQTLCMNSIYHTRGFVLDGYPVTSDQARLLSVEGVRPGLMIELISSSQDDEEELIRRGLRESLEPLAQKKLSEDSGGTQAKTAEEDKSSEEEEDHLMTGATDDQRTGNRPEDGFNQPPPRQNIAEELAVRLRTYGMMASDRRAWISSHQGVLVDLNAIQNRWYLWKQVLVLIKHRMHHLQEYMSKILSHKAAHIAELGIEQWQFKLRAGEFLQYCPVSLLERNELEDTIAEPKHEFVIKLQVNVWDSDRKLTLNANGSNFRKSSSDFTVTEDGSSDSPSKQSVILIPTNLRFGAEYRGHYYRMAGPEELAKFLENPLKYLPPQTSHSLPSEQFRPARLSETAFDLSRDSFPTIVALRGYCPVCFQESKERYEGLRLGLREFLARYNGDIYTFCSNDCLLNFLRRPRMYVGLKLPKKVPPIPNPISVNTLPLPGYLEQTLAINLRMAMSAVGQERPKFPFIGTKRSALIFMGLHLKGYNPRSSQYERQKYQRKLQDYLDACNLPKWLAISMPLLFRSETERIPSLTPRLYQFLGFQQFTDNASAWMEFTDDTHEKPAAQGVRLQLKNPFDL